MSKIKLVIQRLIVQFNDGKSFNGNHSSRDKTPSIFKIVLIKNDAMLQHHFDEIVFVNYELKCVQNYSSLSFGIQT